VENRGGSCNEACRVDDARAVAIKQTPAAPMRSDIDEDDDDEGVEIFVGKEDWFMRNANDANKSTNSSTRCTVSKLPCGSWSF
jgi:hypothetical protein